MGGLNMAEIKTVLFVPDAYKPLLEDVRLLKSDGNNPNKMSIRQKNSLWKSLQKYGWKYPVQVDMNGVFADGEQRVAVCIEHGEFYAPVLRGEFTDTDRRMFRQIANKLKGKHNRELDVQDYMRIIEAGEKDGLVDLLHSVGEKLPEELLRDVGDKVSIIPETYELIVECKDEADQKAKFEELQAKSWKVRVLNL
jgi:ParB-like chromosome segregation protein Spo0J